MIKYLSFFYTLSVLGDYNTKTPLITPTPILSRQIHTPKATLSELPNNIIVSKFTNPPYPFIFYENKTNSSFILPKIIYNNYIEEVKSTEVTSVERTNIIEKMKSVYTLKLLILYLHLINICYFTGFLINKFIELYK